MLDLSAIRNHKLRKLIAASASFAALPHEKKGAQIEKIQHLSPAKQRELCEFFEKENEKEKKKGPNNEEQLEILKKLYEEVVALEKKFTKLLKMEPEMKAKANEDKEMGHLLNKINNH
ncbi:MAG: hypothetical protein O3B47_00470 [bacterium]|nr:hypothetical protein [bacterium]